MLPIHLKISFFAAGTLCKSAETLMEMGAKSVSVDIIQPNALYRADLAKRLAISCCETRTHLLLLPTPPFPGMRDAWTLLWACFGSHSEKLHDARGCVRLHPHQEGRPQQDQGCDDLRAHRRGHPVHDYRQGEIPTSSISLVLVTCPMVQAVPIRTDFLMSLNHN